jgi:cellulose synthase/poly-beta-1,6-N-acetylglucosamine synthase-like glycosyltransferase
MILSFKVIFWVSLGAILYNYAGYPALLFILGFLAQAKSDFTFLLRRKSRRHSEGTEYRPPIAILIAAFNEESVIEERVRNALASRYPGELFEILIGLDSPTDSTPEILARVQSDRVRVFHFRTRRGKLGVISELAQLTSAEILVFTDANTNFDQDCVSNLVRHFVDPRVGAVSGEERRTTAHGTDPAAEGLYWKYECALKMLESRLHLLHSANGGVYAIRRELFQPKPNLIVEDFQIPLALRFEGRWILYDPEAIAVEDIAPTFTSQFERRVRLAAGNFQTLFGCPGYLNPFKGGPAFAYWSHRVLRWLTPFLMLLMFLCCAGLYFDPLYLTLLLLQVVFYSGALIGFALKRSGRRIGLLRVPLYFCSMNAAIPFGLIRFIKGSQSVAWVATPRHGVQAEKAADKSN